MRRLFESFLVLQDRPTGTTPMAAGQSRRSLALSSAQSSAVHPLGRPLARYLGHSVALSLVLSAAPFSPSLDRSAARSSARLVAGALVTSLSFFLVRLCARLLACERWLARLLVWFPARSFAFALMSSRAPVPSFARARSLVPSFARLLGRSFGRPLAIAVGAYSFHEDHIPRNVFWRKQRHGAPSSYLFDGLISPTNNTSWREHARLESGF